MSEVLVKPNGMILLKNFIDNIKELSYVRAVPGHRDMYYTGWRWLPKLQADIGRKLFPGGVPLEILTRIDEHKRLRDIAALRKGHDFQQYINLTLWRWQEEAAVLMVEAKIAYVAYEVGLGKTLAALAAMCAIFNKNPSYRALIITETSLIYQWHIELLNCVVSSWREKLKIDVAIIRGTPKERAQGYARKAKVSITNYASFLADHKRGHIGDMPEIIVLDESQRVKNFGVKAAKALREHLKTGVPYRWALSGTPIDKNYLDVFGVYSILDPFRFVTKRNFVRRYCVFKTIRLRRGGYFQKLVRHIRIEELRGMLAPNLIRRTEDDLGEERPEVTVSAHWVELDPWQQNKYSALKRAGDMDIKAKMVRLRLATLFTSGVDLLQRVSASTKFKCLLEILKEQISKREKTVVFCESRTYIEGVAEALKREKIDSVSITGKIDTEDRAVAVEAFKGGIHVMLCTAAAEAGLNLQVANTVVNIDLPWSPAKLRQRIGRVRPYLGTKKRTIRVINILSIGTVEEHIIQVLTDKIGRIEDIFKRKEADMVGEFSAREMARLI